VTGNPVPIGGSGGALQQVLQASGLGFLLHETRLRERWEEVVGGPAAKIAALESLQGFVLHVRVEGAAWRQEMHYQRDAIRAKANAVLGADIVREVRLR
jgi:predicted nucleic acid-binding Zn ribbon protein